jgi:hypothetical protein
VGELSSTISAIDIRDVERPWFADSASEEGFIGRLPPQRQHFLYLRPLPLFQAQSSVRSIFSAQLLFAFRRAAR